ncbi:serine hydrolase domain-containing protein [Gordonia crocea]|uniref:Beta-lactamase-related domain-containing protein n=1 Tax=Gordonia crocea TaxID=589162 RepID=A0A7I9UXG9_9ACTN|nr:serine hydrolase domain-containing protein [Gordonia crocea]GED97501.1 hypothetical protein nbrc107697_15400 [Gordonia crocea]
MLTVPAAGAQTATCAEPGALASPTSVNLDAAKLRRSVQFAASTSAWEVRVYRHDCLVASYGADKAAPVFSASKSVASLVVGRAVTLGYFSMTDPLKKFFPKARGPVGNITVEQVITQTSGLHFSWPADVAGYLTDIEHYLLHTARDHAPGTTFQYAQASLSLLAAIISRTTGRSFLDFAQAEVFSRVGIARNRWAWIADRRGVPQVAGGLAMRPSDLGRLGALSMHWGPGAVSG